MNEIAGSLAGRDLADFTGVPRHVSAEGCQFQAIGSLPEAGQALLVLIDQHMPLAGQVRWVVDDRFALVFDRPLSRPLRKALENHGRLMGPVRFYLG